MIDVAQQQRQRLLGPLPARPFDRERLVERAPVGEAGQAVARGQRLQGLLGALLIGHVAQRFDHRDQLAALVVDRTGIDGEIQLVAELRHHAPVFG